MTCKHDKNVSVFTIRSYTLIISSLIIIISAYIAEEYTECRYNITPFLGVSISVTALLSTYANTNSTLVGIVPYDRYMECIR